MITYYTDGIRTQRVYPFNDGVRRFVLHMQEFGEEKNPILFLENRCIKIVIHSHSCQVHLLVGN